MNRKSLAVFFVLLAASATAEAGKIYGSIQVNGKAVAKGTAVKLTCSGKSYPTEVGKHGRYSVNVDRNGPCSLSVTGYTGASIDVVSYSEATRYNFLLKNSGSGYSIQRK